MNTLKFCPFCGHQLQEISKFCPYCGRSLNVTYPPRPVVGAVAHTPAPTPPKQEPVKPEIPPQPAPLPDEKKIADAVSEKPVVENKEEKAAANKPEPEKGHKMTGGLIAAIIVAAVLLIGGLGTFFIVKHNKKAKEEEEIVAQSRKTPKSKSVSESESESESAISAFDDTEYDYEVHSSKNLVYACAYDGYVNIRQTASSRAPIVGKFRNGPNGAEYLGEEGAWTYINCDGVVGYVYSKYVQRTPTVSYTGSASADWLEGIWYDCESTARYYFYNNGYYYYQPSCEGFDFEDYGRYVMQDNEVVLYLLYEIYYFSSSYSEIRYGDGTPKCRLSIDVRSDKLGGMERLPWNYDGGGRDDAYYVKTAPKNYFLAEKK